MYLRQVDDRAWPPVKSTNFINLALIKDQKSLRKTIQKSVDEVLGEKECVSYAYLLEGIGDGTEEVEDLVDDNEDDNEELAKNDEELTKHYEELTKGAKSKTNNNLILLQGRPGSGKTTLMNKFSGDWARKRVLQSKLLLLIYLRQLNSQQCRDLTTILQQAFPSLLHHHIEEIKRMDGKDVVFALDGLDEYVPQTNDVLFDVIKGKQLSNAMVIVTSRPAACIEFRQHAARQIEVVGFKREQTLEYINCYFADDKEKAGQLITHLHKYPNLMNMCYLPLHCAMLAFLHEESNTLPESETEFYKHFTLSTLLRSIRKRDGKVLRLTSFDDLPCNDKILFDEVCKIAFEATVASKQVFSLSDLKSMSKITKEEDSLGLVIIDQYFMRYGLDQTYTFLHLTFQEFLGAVYIAQLNESARMKIIQDHRNESHLSVVWQFLYGMMDFSSPHAMEVFKSITVESKEMDLLSKIQYAYQSQHPPLCSSVIDRRVEISDCNLSPSDCTAIGYVVNKAKHEIIELSFRNCYMPVEGTVGLLQQIGTRPFSLILR